MKEEIYYLQTWELLLITRFLFDTSALELDKTLSAIEDTNPQIDQFDALVSAISCIKISDNMNLFSITYKQNLVIITLKQTTKNFTKQIKKYLSNFRRDNLRSCRTQVLSYKKTFENFIKSIGGDVNLKDYKLKDFTYIPIILDEYFNKRIIITNFNLKFPTLKEYVGQSVRIVEELIGEDLDIPIFYDNFLSVEWKLNVKPLYETLFNTNQEITLDKPKRIARVKRRLKYSPQQEKIYDFILECLRKDKYELREDELYRFVASEGKNKDNSVAKAVWKLNAQYKKITNTKVKILKYNRFTNLYEIITNDQLDEAIE